MSENPEVKELDLGRVRGLPDDLIDVVEQFALVIMRPVVAARAQWRFRTVVAALDIMIVIAIQRAVQRADEEFFYELFADEQFNLLDQDERQEAQEEHDADMQLWIEFVNANPTPDANTNIDVVE
jgi:hypothetical protein